MSASEVNVLLNGAGLLWCAVMALTESRRPTAYVFALGAAFNFWALVLDWLLWVTV